MNNQNQRILVMAEGIDQFEIDHPLVPAVALATTLWTENKTLITALRGHGSGQISGRGSFRSSVGERRLLREELLRSLRALNKIARSLDRAAHPGVREKFRMPQGGSYQALLNTARAFATHGAEHLQVFVDRGRPATFATDLTDIADEFDEATQRKHSGRQTQAAGTAGMDFVARRAVRVMRELDAILTPLLASNPPVLAAWKTASHIERDPAPAPDPEALVTPAPAIGSTPTP